MARDDGKGLGACRGLRGRLSGIKENGGALRGIKGDCGG